MPNFAPRAALACVNCGTPLAAAALACPECNQLVHAARLQELANAARASEAAGDRPSAMNIWNHALEFLPEDSAQAAEIREHIDKLRVPQPESPGPDAKPNWVKRLGPLGAALAFLLGKAKFLFFGLTKIKTLFTMLASIGVYWALYGWKFGLGFILGIYVHEMGHVWRLKQFGLRASVPMFIPMFGAVVSLYDSPKDAGEDARIGLAGPIWGAGAALAFLIPQLFAPAPIWLALARTTAWMNLFNLTPVWQLDGGRGMRALDRQQRFLLLGLIVLLWWFTSQGMFLIVGLGALYRLFILKDEPAQGDRGAFNEYAGLLLVFGAILWAIKERSIL